MEGEKIKILWIFILGICLLFLINPIYAVTDSGNNSSLTFKNETDYDIYNHSNVTALKNYYLKNYNTLLSQAVSENNKLRSQLYAKYKKTRDKRYYAAYVDARYAVGLFATLSKKRGLTATEKIIQIKTIQANNAYYTKYLSPKDSYTAIAFSNETPSPSTFRVSGSFESKLPFVYYKGKGLNIYPVTAVNWINTYFDWGKNQAAINILDEMELLIEAKSYNGMTYATLPIYFEYEKSPIPWINCYSQGKAAGLYAHGYNITGDLVYLQLSQNLLNSFKLPLKNGGFVTKTKYGLYFLQYNFLPQHYIFNVHLITMQGLYDCYKFTGNSYSYFLFVEGLKTAKNMVKLYDSGKWTYYALDGSKFRHGSLNTESYHRVHVDMIKWVYQVTGDYYFMQYALKWNNYLKIRGLKVQFN
jgi:hypothetical protein